MDPRLAPGFAVGLCEVALGHRTQPIGVAFFRPGHDRCSGDDTWGHIAPSDGFCHLLVTAESLRFPVAVESCVQWPAPSPVLDALAHGVDLRKS